MRKRIRKTVGAIFLALAIAFTQVPASFAEAVGSGAEYERDADTLITYTGTASVVSVPAGIRVIGTDAFAGNPYIETVTLPASLEVVENGAFRDCPLLDEVYFAEGVHTIESGAFSMCPELDTVKFSSTIMKLGAGVFAGDDELGGVILGKNDYFVQSDGALYSRDRSKLIQVFAGRLGDTFDMPDSVSSIERYAFWGCDDLEYIELSSHLTEIPEFSFSNCRNLEEFTVPYSVRKIGAKAFEDCISLSHITLPVSVTTIHPTAFDGCYDLKISAQEGTPAYEFARVFESNNILLMEKEDTVSDNAIGSIYKDTAPGAQDDSIEEKTVTRDDDEKTKEEIVPDVYDPTNPSDVSKLNVSDYYGQDSSDVIGKTRVVAGNAFVFIDESDPVSEGEFSDLMSEEHFKADFTAKDDGSHVVSKKAYYQATGMKQVEIDSGIEKIDDFAFSRSSMSAVKIPEGVTHIGYGAFYHCENLQQVEIPSTVHTIEPEAFARTKYLTDWKNGSDVDDFLVVGDGILLAYKGDAAKVCIPDHVKKIGGGVFQNHPEITDVVLSTGLTEIGEDAFYGCTSLARVTGGSNVRKISDRAFCLCPIVDLSISMSVEEIGLGAFKLAATDAVVFSNKDKLPKVSYEKTATRLENAGLRTNVFEEVDTAVVADSKITIEHSVLDERYSGFRGVVVTIPDMEGNQARLVYCTLTPNEATGLIEVPSYVRVKGKNYSLTGAVRDAFDAYETYEYWGKGEIKGIILPPSLGKAEDYDTEFKFPTSIPGPKTEEDEVDEVVSNVTDADIQEKTTPQYVTTIVLDSSYADAESVKADVLDDEAYYILYVSEEKENAKALMKAVEKQYGTPVNGQLQILDLSLTDRASNVPITNFGDTKVELWIPISEAMMSQHICAVTLGDDGVLQTIYGTKQKKEDKNYFVFRTNHFSAYGIYAGIGEIGEIIKAESNRILQKDKSPETGEWLNPKWLLVMASFLIGLGLLIGVPFRRKAV